MDWVMREIARVGGRVGGGILTFDFQEIRI
jgi:hypothetical protein